MVMMLFGLLVFLGIHVVGSLRGLRAKLIARVGEAAYKGFFSLLAISGLLLTAYGFALWRANGAPDLWDPPLGMTHLTKLLMVFACIALVASKVPSHIKAWLKHPMLVGVKIWALAHLLANGDVASIVLFGSVLAWAVYDRTAVKRRGDPLPVAPNNYAGDALVVGGGLVLYAALAYLFHPYVIGVPVM
ncbi:NnrU family protein [Xanthobacter versatilis]|uniref:NnrU family protein n=1 Tax=Xanthobacter autotrophicus (strain ATCC BAA-1158 / Py2) TaxID=78245 RepID=UPI00372CA117